jgi:hypothetical protein
MRFCISSFPTALGSRVTVELRRLRAANRVLSSTRSQLQGFISVCMRLMRRFAVTLIFHFRLLSNMAARSDTSTIRTTEDESSTSQTTAAPTEATPLPAAIMSIANQCSGIVGKSPSLALFIFAPE